MGGLAGPLHRHPARGGLAWSFSSTVTASSTASTQAIANATNHIQFEVYIFDKDDVALALADQLKDRSREIPVKVILDGMSSIAAGLHPPATPMPQDFVAPASMLSYLRQDSRVQARPFLNPWFSADHSKVLVIDGVCAWLGGMNLGRKYRYEWHDLMVEVHGPVVASFEDQFRRHWAHAGPLRRPGLRCGAPQQPNQTWHRSRLPARGLDKGPPFADHYSLETLRHGCA